MVPLLGETSLYHKSWSGELPRSLITSYHDGTEFFLFYIFWSNTSMIILNLRGTGLGFHSFPNHLKKEIVIPQLLTRGKNRLRVPFLRLVVWKQYRIFNQQKFLLSSLSYLKLQSCIYLVKITRGVCPLWTVHIKCTFLDTTM